MQVVAVVALTQAVVELEELEELVVAAQAAVQMEIQPLVLLT
jgi:hypothetical protein